MRVPTTISLPQWGLLRIAGKDAAAFIHNQLSQDFLLLPPDTLRLAAWCSAQGRVLVSFLGFKPQPDLVYLLCPVDSLAYALKRLKMFVLRSQCTVEDVSAQWHISAELAPDVTAPSNNSAHMPVSAQNDGFILHLPSVAFSGQNYVRRMVLKREVAQTGTTPQAQSDKNWIFWQILQIASGVAIVGEGVREQYVPQMLNYESVGGINFKKGCYPGQEVVARSQFRGQIKRRTYIAHADGPLQLGQQIYAQSPAGADQSVGSVAQVAGPYQNQHWTLLVLQTEAAQSPIYSESRQTLTVLPLPYPLLTDI